MASEERRLPLFPLNTVLFPNASLPLQIFEERYKLMLKHCLDDDSRFGVVFIKAGREVGDPAIPYSTGTVARIAQLNRGDDRIFIAVAGEQRFEIQTITQYRPYMAARVKLIDDEGEDDAVPDEVTQAVLSSAKRYMQLVEGLKGGWISETHMPSSPTALSYHIAHTLQIDMKEKQKLLEHPSTSARLGAVLDILDLNSETLQHRVARELRGRFSKH